MEKPCVYFLKSLKDRRTYVGSTPTLKFRLFQHHNGLVQATRNRRPLELIYKEVFQTIKEARAQERYYKTDVGRRMMKKILQKYFDNLRDRPPRRDERSESRRV